MSSFRSLRYFIKTYKFNSIFTKIFFGLTTFSLAMLLVFYLFTANTSAKNLIEDNKSANLRLVKQTAATTDLLLSKLCAQMHSTLFNRSVIPVIIATKGQSTEKYAALTGQLSAVVRNDRLITGASLCISSTEQIFCSDGLIYPIKKYRDKEIFEEYFDEPYKNLIKMKGIRNTDLRLINGRVFIIQEFPDTINVRVGTIVFELDSKELANAVDGLNKESGSLISVFGQDGTPIIDGDNVPYYGQLLSNGLMSDSEGSFTYVPGNAVGQTFFYYKSPHTGWIFISSIPSSALRLSVSASSGMLFPFVTLFLIASLCLSLYVTIMILRPVDNLMKSVTPPQKSGQPISGAKDELDFFAMTYNDIKLRSDAFAAMMSNIAPTVLERLLTGYLQGRDVSADSASSILQSIPTKFKENDRYIVIAVQMSYSPEFEADTVKMDFCMISAINVINSAIDKENCAAMRMTDVIIAVIMRFPTDTAAAYIKRAAMEFTRSLFDGIKELPYALYVGKGQTYNHISDIYYSYRGALDDLRRQFYNGNSENDFNSDARNSDIAYFTGKTSHIIESIDEHDYLTASDLCRKFVGEFEAIAPELEVAKNICSMLMDALIEKFLSFQASLSDSLIEEKKLTDSNLFSCDSIESLCRHMTSFYNDVIPRLEAYSRKAQNRYILRAKEYIESNYSDCGLGQNTVAEHVGIHPSYLSRLFKEITGTGLLDYTNEYRIERAKELLKSTTMPAKEIGYKTGFQSMPTFFRVFKKYCGVSPGQYRE